MTLFESSIYIGLKRLRKLLYQMQFSMEKTNRKAAHEPMMVSLRAAKGWYVRAFEVKSNEKRIEYMSECIGEFANVRDDIDFLFEENMVHYKKFKRERPQAKHAGTGTGEIMEEFAGVKLNDVPPLSISEENENERYAMNKKVEIYKIVAQIDADIRKYNNSISRGKTLVG